MSPIFLGFNTVHITLTETTTKQQRWCLMVRLRLEKHVLLLSLSTMLSLIALFCLISPFSAYYVLTIYYNPTKRKRVVVYKSTITNNAVEETSPKQTRILPPPRQDELKPSNFGHSESTQRLLVNPMDLSYANITNSVLNVQEFQAVILAGYGNS